MLRVLRRGTLLMSAMNLLEVGRQAARASDRSPVMRMLDFLEATGPGWAIIDISRSDVVRRELLGDPFPWMNRLWEYRARRELGCISLAPFVGKTTFPWAKAVLNQWEHEAAEVMQVVADARERVRNGTLRLDGTPLPGSCRTNAVFEVLLQRLTKSSLPLDRNQFDDLIHATVSLAYADIVYMDKRWLGLVSGLPFARKAFDRRHVDDSLFYLESNWR